MAIGQINFATIQRIGDVEQYRHQEDSKPMVDQQNIQGQVEQRADKLRHQVMNSRHDGKSKNDADAREEGKNKYYSDKRNKNRTKPQEEDLEREVALLSKIGGGIDIKI